MLIFGHRGAAGLAPENTLKSFQTAIDLDVDGIEFDVRFCWDRLVVFHDKRLSRCTNGQGKLKNTSFKTLRKLDAGAAQLIPTLPEVCELVAKQASSDFIINIELKSKKTAKPVLDYLLSNDNEILFEQFIISSFHYKELKQARKINPDIKIGVLADKRYKKALKFAGDIGAYSFHPCIKSVKQKHLLEAQSLSLKTYVYTVNQEKDFVKLKHWKVDGVFTDFPDRIKK